MKTFRLYAEVDKKTASGNATYRFVEAVVEYPESWDAARRHAHFECYCIGLDSDPTFAVREEIIDEDAK